jgi:hypothetical protein
MSMGENLAFGKQGLRPYMTERATVASHVCLGSSLVRSDLLLALINIADYPVLLLQLRASRALHMDLKY